MRKVTYKINGIETGSYEEALALGWNSYVDEPTLTEVDEKIFGEEETQAHRDAVDRFLKSKVATEQWQLFFGVPRTFLSAGYSIIPHLHQFCQAKNRKKLHNLISRNLCNIPSCNPLWKVVIYKRS